MAIFTVLVRILNSFRKHLSMSDNCIFTSPGQLTKLHHTCEAGSRLLAKNADYASPYLVMPSNSFSIDNILNKTGSSHVLNEEETEPSVQPSQPTAQALSLAVS